MANLHDELEKFLKNWRDDVPAAWRPALEGVEPDLAAVTADLAFEPNGFIHPQRRGHNVAGLPAGSHVFRALEGITPDQVRAVLIGQDPYPKKEQATGRSFEQGDLFEWNDGVADSLKRMVIALVRHRRPDLPYTPSDSAWPGILDRIRSGQLAIQPPKALFDHWESQGVLCLNLGLTLSRFDRHHSKLKPVQPAHMAMWKPVVQALLLHLLQRPGRTLVVMAWGGPARRAFESMKFSAVIPDLNKRLELSTRDHPSHRGGRPFLETPDAFTDANTKLAGIGAPPINW